MSQVIANYAANGNFPITVGGTGTQVKYFPNIPGPSIGVSNTTPSATNSKGMLPIPGNGRVNGQLLTVDVVGSIFTDPTLACPTITVKLYAVTGTQTNPIYSSLVTTPGLTTTSLAFIDEPFRITASISADTNSGVLQGTGSAVYNNVVVTATAALGTTLTGINMSADVPFGLVVGVTFSLSGANNLATLTQFTVSA